MEIPAIPRTEMEKSVLRFRNGAFRFKDNANSVFVLDSIEELDNETLLEFIKLHTDEQVPRLIVLDEYYKVKNPTIYNRPPREAHLSDVRIAHPFARYISAFIQGYTVGNPIKMKHENARVNDAIDELNKSIRAPQLNAEAALDLSKNGRYYEIVYRNKEDKDRVARLDPLKTFVIYDTTVEALPLAGVRYRKNRKGVLECEVYTDKDIRFYTQNDSGLIEAKTPIAHHYNEVPIIEYTNNRFRQADFEGILDEIDAYDAAVSDVTNYMTDLNNAMLVITGNVEIDIAKAQDMKNHNTLLLIPSLTQDGQSLGPVDAKYIYKQYDVQGVEAHKKRLQNDIHRFTNTPDMTDEKFSGQSSGESMKYKLFGLDQVRADKETRMTEGLIKRYRLLFRVKAVAQEVSDVNVDDIQFIFTPNIPRAFYEELKALIEAGGKLSQETLLTLTDLVDDVDEELKRLDKEKEEAVLRDPYEDIAHGNDEAEADRIQSPTGE